MTTNLGVSTNQQGVLGVFWSFCMDTFVDPGMVLLCEPKEAEST